MPRVKKATVFTERQLLNQVQERMDVIETLDFEIKTRRKKRKVIFNEIHAATTKLVALAETTTL